MAPDPKIWRLAKLLVDKHGDEALAAVTERALEAPHNFWTRVAEAVHALRPDSKPVRVARTGSPEGTDGRSADERRGSDDDGRRREVHETLLDAKRKVQRDSN
jgi:hypothetical protein